MGFVGTDRGDAGGVSSARLFLHAAGESGSAWAAGKPYTQKRLRQSTSVESESACRLSICTQTCYTVTNCL